MAAPALMLLALVNGANVAPEKTRQQYANGHDDGDGSGGGFGGDGYGPGRAAAAVLPMTASPPQPFGTAPPPMAEDDGRSTVQRRSRSRRQRRGISVVYTGRMIVAVRIYYFIG